MTIALQQLDIAKPAQPLGLGPKQKEEIVLGLLRPRKTLPAKYFYDARGSALFEAICDLPEYYLTRTELRILETHVHEMAAYAGTNARVVEPGSGSGRKTTLLLDALREPRQYVPVDISEDQLHQAAARLRSEHPGLDVAPVVADYTGKFDLPACAPAPASTLVYFPGSTLGNFLPYEAQLFLLRLRAIMGPRGGLLLGVDLKKDPATLHAAYNDKSGVTAQFNLNVLERLNAELHATFDLSRFQHHATYDPTHGRIEMHLVSTRRQRVSVAGVEVSFEEGESICTEYSYKYSTAQVAELAAAARMRVLHTWTDDRRWFGVFWLVQA
jgi:dimethylhistidine N-methyltransferase